jgi:hypothetical protein
MFIPRINLKIFKTKGQGKVHAKNMNSEFGKFSEIKELLPKTIFDLLGL